MKILFVIRSLENGGAERQLTVLANELGRRGHNVTIAVLHRGGVHDASVDQSVVRLIGLDKGKGWNSLGFLRRLHRLVTELQPDVINGYLSAGNLAATLVHRAAPRAKLIWGIRDSLMEFSAYSLTTQFVYAVASKMSRFADGMIFNSDAGRDYWKQKGWVRSAAHVIPNGIDVVKFQPDPVAGRQMRKRWMVAGDEVVVGMVGRFDPMKGHETFLQTAALLAQRIPKVRFAIVGGGSPNLLEKFQRQAMDLGISGRILWTGPIKTMTAVYNALDVFCLSSRYGEGFPNVLGEAMACGRPCVTTDVGDAKMIAANCARVVPAENSQALADAIYATIQKPLRTGEQIREHIVRNFTIPVLADRTEEAYGLRRPSNEPKPELEALAG